VKQAAEEILVKESTGSTWHRHRRVSGMVNGWAMADHMRARTTDGPAPLTAHTNYQTHAQGSLAA
jgi:hypothetical protein